MIEADACNSTPRLSTSSSTEQIALEDQMRAAIRAWLRCSPDRRPSPRALGLRIAEIAASIEDGTERSTAQPAEGLSRRLMLAGLAVLPAVVGIPTTVAAAEPDPIFAAIEAHKRVYAALEQHVRYQGDLDSELPREEQRSRYTAWDGLTIVETDDPRWIAAERRCQALFEAEDDAILALVQEPPATIQGVMALLIHVTDHEKKTGCDWPDYDEDGCTVRFEGLLLQNIKVVLEGKSRARSNHGTVATRCSWLANYRTASTMRCWCSRRRGSLWRRF